jgi:hypothetical protein
MSNNDPDNPYYSNSVIKHYNQNDQEGIIDINGNMFNIFVQQNINTITLDQIKYFYDVLYVIEIILQRDIIEQQINFNDFLTNIFTVYDNQDIYNIFIQLNQPQLIQMMWLLTFIINTGWFYVDLDPSYNPYDPNDQRTNELYNDLNNIQDIIGNNINDFINAFLQPDQFQLDTLNTIWSQIIQHQYINPNVLSDIIESHISNLFTFIHINNRFIGVDNINNFINLCISEIIPQPQPGLQLQRQRQRQRQPEEKSMSVKERWSKNIDTRKDKGRKYRPQESRKKRTEGINTRRFSQKSQQNNNNTYNTSGMKMGWGGDYTKKKRYLKAIKRNNKKYSIKKKHKKTKKRNRQKRKIVKTYKL